MLAVPLVELSINSSKSTSLSVDVRRTFATGADCGLENISGEIIAVGTAKGMIGVRDCWVKRDLILRGC